MKVRYFVVVNKEGYAYYRPGHGLAIFEDESAAAAYAEACHAGRVIELVEKPKRKPAKRGRSKK